MLDGREEIHHFGGVFYHSFGLLELSLSQTFLKAPALFLFKGCQSFGAKLVSVSSSAFQEALGVHPGLHVGCFEHDLAGVDAGGGWGYTIAIVGAANAVIATAYYITVMREMWMKPVPDGDTTPVKVPAPVVAAIAICGAATLVLGVLPGLIAKVGALSDLTSAFGR